jgi:hypothetical protein
MNRVPLESTAVRSAGYDEASFTLEIEFNSGRIYQYDNVPVSVFEWLVRTSNKGSYVARMINPRYAYRDVTVPPPPRSDAEDDLLRKLEDSVRWLDRSPR